MARLVIALALSALACSRPVLIEDDAQTDILADEPALGFSMVSAGFWTNGTLRSERIGLTTDNFSMLFVYLPDSGLYIVTVEKTEGSQQSGRFAGSELVFSGGRTEIRFLSEGGHLFTDGTDREAWVEYLQGFVFSPSGAGAGDPVVGLARERSHVPGL